MKKAKHDWSSHIETIKTQGMHWAGVVKPENLIVIETRLLPLSGFPEFDEPGACW